MKLSQLSGVGSATLLFMLSVGCVQHAPTAAKSEGGKEKAAGQVGGHSHGAGPHEGAIFEFGRFHAEFTVDHNTKEATVYILGADARTAEPITAETLLLKIKSPEFQVILKAVPQSNDPAGQSSRFVGNHDNLGIVKEFEGSVSGPVNGKPHTGNFKEEAHSDEKK